MATRRVLSRTAPATPARIAQVNPNLAERKPLEYVDIADIVPYEFNPRKNAEAVKFLVESIRQFGFLVPIVIDDNNVLVAGHTRVEAAKVLEMEEVPAIRTSGLTQAQIDAFRIVDNKVAEQAQWDNDLLAGEVQRLAGAGINWLDFGFSREEIDCLQEIVADDCLDTTTLTPVDTNANNERRSPSTVRFTCGEVVFFLPMVQYRVWVDGLRALHNFNEADIVADLQTRLGILR